MENILNFSNPTEARNSVYKIAGLLFVLQLAFPPKQWNNGFAHQSIGHSFIFSDPMAGMNQMAAGLLKTGTSIHWFQLILQLAITAGVAFCAARYLETKAN